MNDRHKLKLSIFMWAAWIVCALVITYAGYPVLAAPSAEEVNYDHIDAYVQSQLEQVPNTGLAYGIVHWVLKPCPCTDLNMGQSGGAAHYNADFQILPGKKWGVVLMNSRFTLDSVVPVMTAASIALNVTYLLQNFPTAPGSSLSFAGVYLILDLILAVLLVFSVYQGLQLVKAIRLGERLGKHDTNWFLIVFDLVFSLGIFFGIPLMWGVLSGLPLQAGYKWGILYIAFPDLTIALLVSSVHLFVAATGRILLTIQKRQTHSDAKRHFKPAIGSNKYGTLPYPLDTVHQHVAGIHLKT